jgi:hypothetical protein
MVAAAWDIRDLLAESPTPQVLTTAEVEALAEELAAYHAHFAPKFRRSEQRVWAEIYLRGLLIADIPRKNTEAMALRLLGAGDGAEAWVRALQQFIGEGGWDDDAILAEHRRLVDESLGEADGVLIVDGSDIAKRGDHSAGAARQWCGSTGKTDLCQTPGGHRRLPGLRQPQGLHPARPSLVPSQGMVCRGPPGALGGLPHPGGHRARQQDGARWPDGRGGGGRRAAGGLAHLR